MRNAVVVLVLSSGLLAACGDDEEAAVDPGAAVAATSDPASAGAEPEASAAADPESEAATPSPTGLASALADVQRVAPRLEGYYRNGAYPERLDEVIDSLPAAGLELAPGNRLGAYRYDPEAVEFVLCLEHSSGAYATYDTAPMATGDQGEDGGCPAL